jgi:putative oxidoreductase
MSTTVESELGGGAQGSGDTQWPSYVRSAARIVFGFLLLRHGLEQVFGYPEASNAARRSFRSLVEVFTLPSALLLMMGLFTFILSGEMAVAYFVAWAPLGFWQSFRTFGQEASILNLFLFLLIFVSGPGKWSGVWTNESPFFRR